MTRTLPWLAKKTEPQNSSSPAPKRRKRNPNSEEDLVDADLNDIATPPPRPKQKKRADRTPSTSPAPGPPDVEYMRPGFNADDIWMMVEDEFYAVAKQYTQHLHYAAYVRQKKQAKSRGEKTLSALGHGTDGRTEKSRQLELQQERETLERKRKEVLGRDKDEEESGEENDPYLQDPQLAGLMTMTKDKGVGSRAAGKKLAGMVKAKSNTRAAAGFSQSPHTASRYHDALDDEGKAETAARAKQKASSSKAPRVFEEFSEDEEDLDPAPPQARPARREPEVERRARPKEKQRHRSSSRTMSDGEGDSIFKPFAQPKKRAANSEAAPSKRPASPPVHAGEDDDYGTRISQPIRPTYKKALKRQASQAAAVKQEAPSRTPLRPTGSENGLFARSLATVREKEASKSLAATDTTGKRREKPHSSNTIDKPSPKASKPAESPNNEAKAAAAGYLARHKDRREREEKRQQGKPKRVDDIPTFLF